MAMTASTAVNTDTHQNPITAGRLVRGFMAAAALVSVGYVAHQTSDNGCEGKFPQASRDHRANGPVSGAQEDPATGKCVVTFANGSTASYDR